MYLRNFAAVLCVTATGAVAQQAPEPGGFTPISAIPRPTANPAVADLGYLLFFDPRLSGDASTSCADCHDPSAGWTDGADLARGYPGTKHWRNSQTVVNASLLDSGLHWDGGLASTTEQVHDAMGASFVANIEMNLVEERLRQIPEYRTRFKAIWGAEPTADRFVEAITTYESTLISDDSPFDRYLGGDTGAMSASALRGMEIFSGKGNCTTCHNGPLLTDGETHNISVPTNPEFAEDPLRQVTFRYLMRIRGIDQAIYDNFDRDPGRYANTLNPDDLGAFRTPPLRYLSYTAPYMHNGIFFTLDEVVEFYNIGGTQDVFGTKSPLIQPLGLSKEEKADLVAFLESMSGSEIRVDRPDLPDYDMMPRPNAGAIITAAKLRGTAIEESGPTAASQAGQLPDAPPGLKIETQGGGDSGLTLVPRGADEPEASNTPDAQEGSGIRLDLRGTDAGVPGRINVVAGERFVTVQSGDTLRSLAALAYGDEGQFRKILVANTDQISNPNILILGRKLRIPD